jgi:tetratricopeptide (TPR) repeat protein
MPFFMRCHRYTRPTIINLEHSGREAALKCYYCYELAWDEAHTKYYEEYSKVNKEIDPRLGYIALDAKRGWHHKGYDFSNLGEYKKAIECYNRAIELDCNNIYAWNGKGLALYFLGEYEKAIECYENALQLSPDRIDISINKGLALRKFGEYQQAIMCFNKAKAINPK